MGGSINRLAASSFLHRWVAGSKCTVRPSCHAIFARLTSVADRWPFCSFNANFFRVRTATLKSPSSGSGSGSAASLSFMFGIVHRNPLNNFPFGPSMKGISSFSLSPSRTIRLPSEYVMKILRNELAASGCCGGASTSIFTGLSSSFPRMY